MGDGFCSCETQHINILCSDDKLNSVCSFLYTLQKLKNNNLTIEKGNQRVQHHITYFHSCDLLQLRKVFILNLPGFFFILTDEMEQHLSILQTFIYPNIKVKPQIIFSLHESLQQNENQRISLLQSSSPGAGCRLTAVQQGDCFYIHKDVLLMKRQRWRQYATLMVRS